MELAALANGTSPASIERQGIAADFNTFLTLLTTQLQNQDPLEPTDSNEFTRQLVAFAGVEQQIATNQNLENISTLTAFSQTLSSVGFLGKFATVPGDTGQHNGVDGVSFEYELPRAAERTTVRILDNDKNVVFEAEAATNFGIHRIDWPGTDSAGNPLPAGEYRLEVRAVDENDKVIPVSSFTRAEVTEVETSGAAPVLTVGGRPTPLNQILAVSSAR